MRSRLLGISVVTAAVVGALSCGQTETVTVDIGGTVDTLVLATSLDSALTTVADTTIGAPDTVVVTRFDTIFAPADTVVVLTVDTVLVPQTTVVTTTDTVVIGSDTTFIVTADTVTVVDTVVVTGVDTVFTLDTVVVTRTDTVVTVDTVIVVDTITVTPILTASTSSLDIEVGETAQLSVTAQNPLGYQSQPGTVTWFSDAEGVATVSGSGLVEGISPGLAYVYVLAQGMFATIPTNVSEPVTVLPPPPPPGGSIGGGPNEPTGFTRLTERHFRSGSEAGWWAAAGWGASNVVAESSAPTGDNLVGRITFPQGLPGSGPTAVTGYTFGAQPRDIYIAVYHKVSANWQNHPAGTDKIFFAIDLSHGQGGTPFFVAMGNNNGSSYEYVTWIQSTVSPTQPLLPNRANVRAAEGQWAFLEILVRHQTSPGASNGEIHLWVNGTKTTQYTNVLFQDSGGNRTFDHIKWEPVWGGVGGTVAQTQYQYMDHFYLSGR